MAGAALYLPGQGRVNLEKDIIEVNRQDLQGLSWLHEFADKHQINIFCKRCEQPISGQNNDTPGQSHVSVNCGCREWRFKLRQ